MRGGVFTNVSCREERCKLDLRLGVGDGVDNGCTPFGDSCFIEVHPVELIGETFSLSHFFFSTFSGGEDSDFTLGQCLLSAEELLEVDKVLCVSKFNLLCLSEIISLCLSKLNFLCPFIFVPFKIEVSG